MANTKSNGSPWTLEEIEAVWKKGKRLPDKEDSKFRKDCCDALIERSKYADTTENGHGWEIDHIRPVAKGGGDDLENLQPLQWENNRNKSDNYPNWQCKLPKLKNMP